MIRKIQLRNFSDGLGLIYQCRSGFVWENQCGGYACKHRTSPGVFIPLDFAIGGKALESIKEHFRGEKWGGWCSEGIDEDTASFLEETIGSDQIRISRSRFEESVEAWVYCEIFPNGDGARFPDLPEGTGVLVWQNSD